MVTMTSLNVGVACIVIASVVMTATFALAAELPPSSPPPLSQPASTSQPNSNNNNNNNNHNNNNDNNNNNNNNNDTPSPATNPKDLHRMILDTMTLDLNQDGCLAGIQELDSFRDHVAKALSGMAESEERARGIVGRADVNKDGRICWCDFISIYLHDRTNGGHHAFPFLVIPDSAMFTQLDSNLDGRLSGTERIGLVKEFATCLPLPLAQSIAEGMDATESNDGSITLGEFAEYLKNPPPFQWKILELLTQNHMPLRMGMPQPALGPPPSRMVMQGQVQHPWSGSNQVSNGLPLPQNLQQPNGLPIPQRLQLPNGLPVPQNPHLPNGMSVPQKPQFPNVLHIPQKSQLPNGLRALQTPQLSNGKPVPMVPQSPNALPHRQPHLNQFLPQDRQPPAPPQRLQQSQPLPPQNQQLPMVPQDLSPPLPPQDLSPPLPPQDLHYPLPPKMQQSQSPPQGLHRQLVSQNLHHLLTPRDLQYLQQLHLLAPNNNQLKTPAQQGDAKQNHQSNQLPQLPAKEQADNSIPVVAQEPQQQLASLVRNSH